MTATSALAIVVGLIVLGFSAWALWDVVIQPPATRWTSDSLTVVGFLLTGGALCVALLIFQVQKQDSDMQQEETRDRIAAVEQQNQKTHQLLADLKAKSAEDVFADMTAIDEDRKRDDPELLPQPSPPTSAPSEELLELGIPADQVRGIQPFRGEDIPLLPLSILLNGLESDPDYGQAVEGKPAHIKPRDLAAYRRTGVQGPSAWYVVVPTAPGSGRNPEARRGRSLWKVSLRNHTIERLDKPPPRT